MVARYAVISWGREVPLELHCKTYCQVKKCAVSFHLKLWPFCLSQDILGYVSDLSYLG